MPEHHMHGHPGHLDPFEPEHPPAHAMPSMAEQLNAQTFLALRSIIDMAEALRTQAAAATAEMHRAALINADLTSKNAALSAQVTDLEAQVATLSAHQEDPAAEQTAADDLAAATAALKSADDVAQPPPPEPAPEPAPAEEPTLVEPDPNAPV